MSKMKSLSAQGLDTPDLDLHPKTTDVYHSPTSPMPPTPRQSGGSKSPFLSSCIFPLEDFDAIHRGQETISLLPSQPIK